jgi:hypothetical protein
MAEIKDLNINHVRQFLSENRIIVPKNVNQIYDEVFNLMMRKSKSFDDVDISIIEWILAYNALKRNIINKIYNLSDITSLSDSELKKLSKKLGMQNHNIINIINILRFMHKFNNKIYGETLTGNYDTDKIILQILDNESLNNLYLNNYTKEILNDQNFWRERLQRRLGLKSNKNLDFNFIGKILDNGKSFEENYQYALKNKLNDVIDLLLENNAVLVNKPKNLLDKVRFIFDDLGKIKNYPYDKFIQYILDKTDEDGDEDEEPIDLSYFGEKVYEGDAIIIEIPNFSYNSDSDIDELSEETKTVVLRNKNGFTNGEILYQLAQKIPNNKEIKDYNIMIVKKYSNEILNEINEVITTAEERGDDRALNYLMKYYNPTMIKELLKDPVKFLEYNEDHRSSYIISYNMGWGDPIYWLGLFYSTDGKYEINH